VVTTTGAYQPGNKVSKILDIRRPCLYRHAMTLRLLVLAVVVSLGSACGGASSAGPPDRDGDLHPQGTPQSTASPPAPGSPNAVLVKTAAGPVGLAMDSRGRVWVANADAGTLSRLSAAGDAVDLDKPVGSAPLRLAVTPGSVWVTVFRDGTLRRLDARTGRVTGTVDVGETPEGVTAAAGSIWVVLEDPGQLAQVDPTSLQVMHRYPVGPGPRLVTAGHGALWVSSFSSGRVITIDPATGQVRKSGAVCVGPQGMVVLSDTVWVACTVENKLVGIDRRTLKTTARLDLPGSPDAVRAGPNGELLVALQKGPTLAVVDPAGPKVLRRDRLGHVDQLFDQANIDLLVRDGTAWVSSYLEGGVYRIRL
jgi:DNA-binding beta-propeller fold protein YncE